MSEASKAFRLTEFVVRLDEYVAIRKKNRKEGFIDFSLRVFTIRRTGCPSKCKRPSTIEGRNFSVMITNGNDDSIDDNENGNYYYPSL